MLKICAVVVLVFQIGIENAQAQSVANLNFSVSLRIDDPHARSTEQLIRKDFFEYLLSAEVTSLPSFDRIAVIASRGSFSDDGIRLPIWAGESKLPSLLAVLEGKQVANNACDLGYVDDPTHGTVLFVAFDPDNVGNDFADDCIATGYLLALGYDAPSNLTFSNSYEFFKNTYSKQEM